MRFLVAHVECGFSSPRVAEVDSLCGDTTFPRLIFSGGAYPPTYQGGAHRTDVLCWLLDLCGVTRIHLFLAKPRFLRPVVRVARIFPAIHFDSSSIRFAPSLRLGRINHSMCSQESIAPVDQKLSYLPSRLDGRREP